MAIPFIDGLHREHHEMRSILALMQDQLNVIEQGGIPDMALFGYALYYMRNFPAALHHPKEDLMFERLQKRAPFLASCLNGLREQHRVIYELENWLAEMAAQVPMQGAAAYPRVVEFGRRYLMVQREHAETEERQVFPLAEKLLKPEDWESLDDPSPEAAEALCGAGQLQRFLSLFGYIMKHAGAETGKTGSDGRR